MNAKSMSHGKRSTFPERLLAVRTMLVPGEVLFFYVLVRHALLEAEVPQAEVADYLAALLLEFGQRDRSNRVAWHDDHSHRYLVDILADLDESTGERNRATVARSRVRLGRQWHGP